MSRISAVQGRFKGWLFAFLLLFSSTFGTIFFLTPFLPVMFVLPKVARKCMDVFIWLWKVYAVAVYETLFDIKFVMLGDPPPHGECVLIVMNHRTRFDWLYLFSYQVRYGSVKHYTISLKNVLKFVPGAGWAMQMAGYIFLRRKWEEDEVIITRSVKVYKALNFKPHFLLFPEGTDLTKNTKARSDKYAEEKNVPKYEYVLHPRTTGFTHIVQQMREANILDAVVDVTIAYPKNIPQTETEILKGKFPEEIHYLIRRHPASELPRSKEDLDTWCKDCWSLKERTLRDFYEKKKFSKCNNMVELKTDEDGIKSLFLFCWMFWGVFQVVVCVTLYLYPFTRWYCLANVIMYILISKYTDGIGMLIASSLGI